VKKKVAMAFVLLLLAAPLGVELQHRWLAHRLIAAANELEKDHPRPVHRQPTIARGNFEDCVGPLIDAPPDAGAFSWRWWMHPESAHARVEAIGDGDAGVDVLTDDDRGELAAALPWAESVAACARTISVGSAAGLGPLADLTHPRSNGVNALCIDVPQVLLTNARLETSRGGADRALATCADVIALAADLVRDRGLAGAKLATSAVTGTLFTCAEAIEAASDGARAQFDDELGTIHRNLPTFADVMRADTVRVQLTYFGAQLFGFELEQLPPDARVLAHALVLRWSLVRWLFWNTYAARMERLIAGLERGAPDPFHEIETQPSVLEELMVKESSWWPGSMRVMSLRYERVPHVIALLRSAVRFKRGEPPLPGVTLTQQSPPWVRLETADPEGGGSFALSLRRP
jgi:hypothetical protein